MMGNHDDFDALTSAWLDGRATPEDATRLGSLVKADPALRDRLLCLADIHALLTLDPRVWGSPEEPARVVASARRRVAPSWAFAAGLLLGIVPAGIALALTRPTFDSSPASPVPIHDGDFEFGSAPASVGLPERCGTWGGDFSEIVTGPQQGVSPFHGQRMLRFLRSDFQGETSIRSATGEVFQVIDLRGWDRPPGPVGVEVAGRLNATRVPHGEDDRWVVHAFAFDTDPTTRRGQTDHSWLYRECLASAHRQAIRDDSDPAAWQRVGVELLIPPTANFLVVSFGVQRVRPAPSADPVLFPGHYLDAVEIVPLLPSSTRR